jgi:hypothetical protein
MPIEVLLIREGTHLVPADTLSAEAVAGIKGEKRLPRVFAVPAIPPITGNSGRYFPPYMRIRPSLPQKKTCSTR